MRRRRLTRLLALRELRLPAAALGGTALGGALFLAGYGLLADAAWAATALAGLVPALREMAATIRARRPGVDVVAVLAIAGALAPPTSSPSSLPSCGASEACDRHRLPGGPA
jgi:cation transport ATPase